ncbi:MAG TPA: cell division protein FtsQ/DivIB [Steroidobacteraceae bacterium]|nr:cell division protein FtsQ/DivIB [Steroidobacteraceae bacterium]
MMAGVLQRRNRYKRRRSASPPLWRRFGSLLDWRALAHKVALVAFVAAGIGALTWALNRPVRAVAIDGRFQHVSPIAIEKAVAPYLVGGFMSVNLEAIQRAVEAIPWVDRVRVQRRWPTGLRVTVIEQTAAARWNGTGLLNGRGELFLRGALDPPPQLPSLGGPSGSETEVAKRYFAAQPPMAAAGFPIAALRLDERGAWRMDLANGLAVRLGRKHVARRLSRFIRTASQIVLPRLDDVAYVDMRYSNGFAVGWRGGAHSIAGAARTPAKMPRQPAAAAPAPAQGVAPAQGATPAPPAPPAPVQAHVQKAV